MPLRRTDSSRSTKQSQQPTQASLHLLISGLQIAVPATKELNRTLDAPILMVKGQWPSEADSGSASSKKSQGSIESSRRASQSSSAQSLSSATSSKSAKVFARMASMLPSALNKK